MRCSTATKMTFTCSLCNNERCLNYTISINVNIIKLYQPYKTLKGTPRRNSKMKRCKVRTAIAFDGGIIYISRLLFLQSVNILSTVQGLLKWTKVFFKQNSHLGSQPSPTLSSGTLLLLTPWFYRVRKSGLSRAAWSGPLGASSGSMLSMSQRLQREEELKQTKHGVHTDSVIHVTYVTALGQSFNYHDGACDRINKSWRF